MQTAVPAVEVANHRDPLGVGRPDAEAHPGDALDGLRVGAEEAVALDQPSGGKEKQVVGRGLRRGGPDDPAAPGRPRPEQGKRIMLASGGQRGQRSRRARDGVNGDGFDNCHRLSRNYRWTMLGYHSKDRSETAWKLSRLPLRLPPPRSIRVSSAN